MKNILYIIIAGLLLSSCNKHEAEMLFDQKPEERMIQRNSELRSKLLEAPNGWKASLRTNLRGGAYGFFMKFDDQEKVNMVSDWNNTAANNVTSSTYRIQYVMNTSLIFDSYNYITIMQDPNTAVNGGSTLGNGLESDIEFEYIRSTADSVVLRGKKYMNYLYLVKASAGEESDFTSAKYGPSITEMNNYLANVANKYIQVPYNGGTVNLAFNFNVPNKLITSLVEMQDKSVKLGSGGFAHGMNEVSFNNSIDILGYKFVAIRKKGTGSYVVIDNTGKEYPILSASIPVVAAKALFESGAVNATAPNVTTFPGWGADFITRRATVNTSLNGWNIGGSPLQMGAMSIRDLNPTSKIFMLRIAAPYGGNITNLDYQYRLVINPDGSYKFNYMTTLTGNASTVIASTNALLAQRINVDTFNLDYFTDPATNVTYLRFTSVQNPTFVFTGTF